MIHSNDTLGERGGAVAVRESYLVRAEQIMRKAVSTWRHLLAAVLAGSYCQPRLYAALFGLGTLLCNTTASYAQGMTIMLIRPSETNSEVRYFDAPHYVVRTSAAQQGAELLVFLPGTRGAPRNLTSLLNLAAEQGYNVIGLEYADDPAVVTACGESPIPDCSFDFRYRRIVGRGEGASFNKPTADSILGRLTSLLEFLQRRDPQGYWSNYISQANQLNWRRIAFGGFSQGAGMAALIGKRREVARVVLFSGPRDFQMISHRLAPWLQTQSATPLSRWFAEYHVHELKANVLALAYGRLGIPKENIRVFSLPLLTSGLSGNPFHISTVRNLAYEAEWQFLLGRSQ
jgi:dienelactone hydrolase